MGSRANLILGLAIASVAVLVFGVVAIVGGGGKKVAGPSATPSPELTTAPPITTTVVVTPPGATPTVGPPETPFASPTPQATPTPEPSPQPTSPPMAITGTRSWMPMLGLVALILGTTLVGFLGRHRAA